MGWTTRAEWARLPVDQRRYDFIRLLRQAPAITELTRWMDWPASSSSSPASSRTRSAPISTFRRIRASPAPCATASGMAPSPPTRLRALHGDRHRPCRPQRGRDHRRGQSETRLGRGDRDPRRRDGLRLRDRPARKAHRPSGHEPRAARYRPLPAAAGGGGDRLAGTGGRRGPRDRGDRPDGRAELSAFTAVPKVGWLVFVELPRNEAFAAVWKALYQTLALLGLGIGLAAVAGTLLARRLSAPIRELRAGAEQLGRGDLASRIPVARGDEIGALATSFNVMAERIQEAARRRSNAGSRSGRPI